MNNSRKVFEPTPAARNDTKPECRNSISGASLDRVLSVDTVIDDMRAILWPDVHDQECPDEIDFGSRARK